MGAVLMYCQKSCRQSELGPKMSSNFWNSGEFSDNVVFIASNHDQEAFYRLVASIVAKPESQHRICHIYIYLSIG